jgi:N-acetylneuraminic acid mutarotase
LAVGVVNNKIYAIGGANNATTFATMEEYNPSTNTWATKAPMPTGRTQLAVGVVNVGGSDKIYAIGGLANGINLTTVEEYDPGTNTWTTKVPMPTGRRALAVGVVGGKIYAIGGSGDVCVHCATVEEYDPATNTWTTKTPMPTGRYGLAVGVVGSKIYVVGGTSSASSYLTTVEEGTLAP